MHGPDKTAQQDAIVSVLLAAVQDLQERVARLELDAELRELGNGGPS